MRIAKQASTLATEHGEIAVFVGSNGQTAAALWYEPGYAQATGRRDLAGVYRHSDGQPITRMVREDVLACVGRAA
jgi:hypothetical protein